MGERPGKAAILRAAVEVMGEDGYEGASVRSMAARAGVSVAALYYHFPSKHDLLREFLDEAWDVTLARIDRRLQGVPVLGRSACTSSRPRPCSSGASTRYCLRCLRGSERVPSF